MSPNNLSILKFLPKFSSFSLLSGSKTAKAAPPKSKTTKPSGYCLEVTIAMLSDQDRSTKPGIWLRNFFTEFGDLGCMRPKCKSCDKYCRQKVIQKSEFKENNKAMGVFQVFFRDKYDLDQAIGKKLI